MKHFTSTLVLVTIMIATQGQQRFNYLNIEKRSENATLQDYQQAFEKNWERNDIKNAWYTDENGKKQKACGWKQFKRWEGFWESRVKPGTGEFPDIHPAEAFSKHIEKHGAYKAAKSANWTNMGTNSAPGGYYGIGRINTIAFHPTNDDIFWVGAASGGLWKTADAGVTWEVLTDQIAVLGVSAIGIPSDFETSQTIYIGTGDRDGADCNSTGILKSTNGGQTWEETGLTFPVNYNKSINKIIIDPEDDAIIYVATTEGFFISSDYGESFTNQWSTSFIDFELCPENADIMYGGTANGLFYRSVNRGQSWQQIYNTTSGNRLEIAVSADGPNIVYFVCANGNNGLFGIYKSNNYGENFDLIYNESNILGWSATGNGIGGQGSYDLALAADPNNVDIVYCGGINTWKSTDGGSTWEINNYWDPAIQYIQNVHADKHYMAFRHNTSTLFECNDGGVYVKDDNDYYTDLSNGLVISQIYGIGVAQSVASETMNGLQDNGSKLQSGSQWTDVLGGDGFECLIDYDDINTQYGSIYYGQIRRTTNHWYSWVQISQNIPGGENGNWLTPFIIDPFDHNTIYIGYNKLWKSTDKGISYENIGNFPDKLDNLAICQTDNQVIVASTHNFIRITRDGGVTWIDITDGIPVGSSKIKYASIKYNDPYTIWVAMSGYNENNVFKTTDGGLTWSNISQGLPEIPLNCVIQNKLENTYEQIYAATDYGVYIKNGDDDWTLYSNGLPNVIVRELEIYYDMDNYENCRLRGGTYGRGLWETPLDLSGNYGPLVNTLAPSDISISTASITGSIEENYGLTVSSSGFIYSTTPNQIHGGENVVVVETEPVVSEGNFTIEISGLEPNSTTYYYKAFATNENGTVYGVEKRFNTLCEDITTMPYIEDFESNVTVPGCWHEECVSGDNVHWTIRSGAASGAPTTAYSGTNNLLFYDTDAAEDKTMIISPMMDITTLQSPQLTFWLAISPKGSYIDELKIFYRYSEENEWAELQSYNSAINDWTQQAIPLPNPSTTYQLAFEGNALNGNGICIDDYRIQESTAINNVNNEMVKIHPNPADEQISISLYGQDRDAVIKIISTDGKILITQKVDKENNTLNVSELQIGMYLISIETKENTYHKNLIIK